MKLGPGEAVLPLGGKDKLCQAALRMRQLGDGQSLVITAQRDVAAEIVALQRARRRRGRGAGRGGDGGGDGSGGGGRSGGKLLPPGAIDVLFWVLSNSAAATRAGLLEVAANGLHYLDTLGEPERAALQSLEDYAPPAADAPVAEVVAASAARMFGPERSPPKPEVAPAVAEVVDCVRRHGATLRVPTSPLDEECEREMEQQKEQGEKA